MNARLESLSEVLDRAAVDCCTMSRLHGFYDEEDQILAFLPPHMVEGCRLRFALSKIDLLHSEASEMTEAVRKPWLKSDHIPDFTLEEEEAADVFIRLMDIAGRRHLRIGAAVVAKMAFNKERPYMHGKKA